VRIAALYDIHGNLPALEAALDEIGATGVDRIVIGGDVVPGPMPRETLERLLGLDVPTTFIRGNCDRDVVVTMAGEEPVRVPEQHREAFRWCARQLGPEHQREIETWPLTSRIDHPALGIVVFCHATPRDDNEIVVSTTADSVFERVLDGLGASLVVCGHTHMQFDRTVGRTRIVNAGSVGMPMGRSGADWLLLGDHVELRNTQYDVEAAAALFRESGYPAADDTARALIRPPSQAEMLAYFERTSARSGP
jgi:putative phosphoesterase